MVAEMVVGHDRVTFVFLDTEYRHFWTSFVWGSEFKKKKAAFVFTYQETNVAAKTYELIYGRTVSIMRLEWDALI